MDWREADTLIRTKVRPPFTRLELVPRPGLHARMAEGLRRPLTLVAAPAGFGKTTLVASHVTASGMPVAWLSLDKADNEAQRFLGYLVAALQEADNTIGSDAARLLSAARQASPEAVVTSLVNDLDAVGREIALVLDDYQSIVSQAVHEAVGFLLEHCPTTCHLVIASRSDPPLPLVRMRARGQTVELRAAELSFTEPEAAQFLNEVMRLGLDAQSIAVLEERTEGWIAGLQMAALSMRDRADASRFVQGFSGTNRYILDYLLEEVLANQSPAVQHFLLHTSILERLTAPLCDAILADDGRSRRRDKDPLIDSEALFAGRSASILEHLERANLFLVPLDDERSWYRYHHLFADLLRTQLQASLGVQRVTELHVRASEWHAQHGSIPEAIDYAAAALDDERVERLIEQHYMEMVSRGEMSGMRLWAGKLSEELVYRRPWLCIYEAYSRAWFGELDEAILLLEEVEGRIRSGISAPDVAAMQAQLAYVQSRVTAMRGDIERAIELCLAARENIPAGNLALDFDSRVTLGYEYFLSGDHATAGEMLSETIRSGISDGAIIHTVAASCFMARLYAVQGLLNRSYDTYQTAAQLIADSSDHLDAKALLEAGTADVLCEWNDLDSALVHVMQSLALLPQWGKADDTVLAYNTLARIRLAQANQVGAAQAIGKSSQIIQTRGVFPEARDVTEAAQVKLWLALGDVQAASRWAASREVRLRSDERFRFENELARITQARVLIAQDRPQEAIGLLSDLEAAADSAGRSGRLIEILLLEALAQQKVGDSEQAIMALTACLTLAEPQGYARVFLDEGQAMRLLLAQWLAQAGAGHLRDYASCLLSHFEAKSDRTAGVQEAAPPAGDLVETLTQRELEVLHLIALGRTNKQIAQQLVVAPGTIKAHTSGIYRKLDVGNRTEAVARARQLGIIP